MKVTAGELIMMSDDGKQCLIVFWPCGSSVLSRIFKEVAIETCAAGNCTRKVGD